MSEEIKNSETENIETPAAEAAPEKTETAAETAAPETPAAAAETTEASADAPASSPARRPDSGRGNARPQHRSSGERGGDRSSFQRPNRFRRKSCRFCHDEKIKIEYKNPDMLEKFITDRGKILPRRITGTCARHQRALSTEIKRARILALLPFVLQ